MHPQPLDSIASSAAANAASPVCSAFSSAGASLSESSSESLLPSIVCRGGMGLSSPTCSTRSLTGSCWLAGEATTAARSGVVPGPSTLPLSQDHAFR